MLELIRAVSECKDARLMGKYLAKAEIVIHEREKDVSAVVLTDRDRLSVVRAAGLNSALTLYLMPKGRERQNKPAEIPDGHTELSITVGEVEDYLELSGDTNPIHRGEGAVIPGLLIIIKVLGLENIEAEARFLAPAHIGDRLYAHKTDEGINIYTAHCEIIKIREKRSK